MNLTRRTALWFAFAVACATTLLVAAGLADDTAAPVVAGGR
jgi:hypothetical protein